MNALMQNSKTIKSIDLSTICPKLEANNPCSYCYVQASRDSGFRGKSVIDRLSYDGEILRLRDDSISKLNAVGGLRMFAFADYKEWMNNDIERIIRDSQEKGLQLKAITKQTDFVSRFHAYMNIINVSIDNVGHGVSHDTAKELRDTYDNVKIRCAIMHDDDIEALSFSNIFTFNHARNGFKIYSKKEVAQWREKLNNRVCCITGKCETCNLKCGLY